MPLGLLENCLHACSARQLARIEDETRCIIMLFCLTTIHPLRLQASVNDQGSCFASMPLRHGHVGRSLRKATAASYIPHLKGPLTLCNGLDMQAGRCGYLGGPGAPLAALL